MSSARLSAARLAWLVFGLALAFYVYTLQPGLAWGDGTRLQREAVTGESFILAEMVAAEFAPDPWPFARLGVAAWDHPLYVMLAHSLVRLAPGVRALWLVNLVSAVFAAGAVALAFVWVAGHTGSPGAAWIAAGGLAASHTFWFHAVTPEVYSLLCFLILLSLVCWDRYGVTGRPRWLLVAGVALGLAAANHLLALLALPGLALSAALGYRRATGPRARHLAPAGLVAAGFGLGFSPFLVQLARMLRTFTLAEVTGPAVGTTFLASLLTSTPLDLLHSLATFIVLIVLQFNPVGAGLGVWGLWRGGQLAGRPWRIAVAGFAVYGLFGVLYRVSDQFAFFQMAYMFFALGIGFGVGLALTRLAPPRRRAVLAGLTAGIALMPALYGAAPGLARAMGAGDALLGIPVIGTGVRNGLAYYVNPNKRGDYSAEAFGRGVLSKLPPEALVLAEWYTDTDEYFVLRYFQAVEGLRPDVTLMGWPTQDPFSFDTRQVAQLIEAEVGRRPIYLASLSDEFYAVSALEQHYCFVPEHELYRLYPRATASAHCP
jgi:hypothetical protein